MDLDLAPIDAWNVDTFDIELRGDLDAHADLIRDGTPSPTNERLGQFLMLPKTVSEDEACEKAATPMRKPPTRKRADNSNQASLFFGT